MASPIRLGVKAVIIQDQQVLLIEYNDMTGLHYNFPGGGVKRGESVRQCLKREVREETCCDVKVGRLLMVGEYDPRKHANGFGRTHKLTLYFACTLKEGSQPDMPPAPDANQTGVNWFPVEAPPATLYPQYHDLLIQAAMQEDGRDLFTNGL